MSLFHMSHWSCEPYPKLSWLWYGYSTLIQNNTSFLLEGLTITRAFALPILNKIKMSGDGFPLYLRKIFFLNSKASLHFLLNHGLHILLYCLVIRWIIIVEIDPNYFWQWRFRPYDEGKVITTINVSTDPALKVHKDTRTTYREINCTIVRAVRDIIVHFWKEAW